MAAGSSRAFQLFPAVTKCPARLRIRSAGRLSQQAGQVEKRAAAEIQNFGSPRLPLTGTQVSLVAALFPLTRKLGLM